MKALAASPKAQSYSYSYSHMPHCSTPRRGGGCESGAVVMSGASSIRSQERESAPITPETPALLLFLLPADDATFGQVKAAPMCAAFGWPHPLHAPKTAAMMSSWYAPSSAAVGRFVGLRLGRRIEPSPPLPAPSPPSTAASADLAAVQVADSVTVTASC